MNVLIVSRRGTQGEASHHGYEGPSRRRLRSTHVDDGGISILRPELTTVVTADTFLREMRLMVGMSADGRFVVAGGGDRVLLLVDATNGKTIRRSVKLSDPIMFGETSPDGSTVAVVTPNADDPQRSAPVVLAKLPDLTVVKTWPPPAGVILPGAVWGVDGHFRVVTQSGPDLHLWMKKTIQKFTLRPANAPADTNAGGGCRASRR